MTPLENVVFAIRLITIPRYLGFTLTVDHILHGGYAGSGFPHSSFFRTLDMRATFYLSQRRLSIAPLFCVAVALSGLVRLIAFFLYTFPTLQLFFG
jgi:hypothetical protein